MSDIKIEQKPDIEENTNDSIQGELQISIPPDDLKEESADSRSNKESCDGGPVTPSSTPTHGSEGARSTASTPAPEDLASPPVDVHKKAAPPRKRPNKVHGAHKIRRLGLGQYTIKAAGRSWRALKKKKENEAAAAAAAAAEIQDDTNEGDLTVAEVVQEELKWPNKVCGFCRLDEKSRLGQGELMCVELTAEYSAIEELASIRQSMVQAEKEGDKSPKHLKKSKLNRPSSRDRIKQMKRMFSFSNIDVDIMFGDLMEEVQAIGYSHDDINITSIFDPIGSGHCYTHRMCAVWSEDVKSEERSRLLGVDKAIVSSMGKKCWHCGKYGASIVCHIPDCGNAFHLPCAVMSGAFMDFKGKLMLCVDHQHDAPMLCGPDSICIICRNVGDVGDLLYCSTCQKHFHTTCFDPPAPNTPVVRLAWQCPACKKCSICRKPTDESKFVVCGTCDKAFHTTCMTPPLAGITKPNWKCKNCRFCGDCGSKTPGSGPSSRWHSNCTVCDSCYQQRNKGIACPVCCRAYRYFAQQEMVQCALCKRFVHSYCDTHAENIAIQVQQMKEGIIACEPPSEYKCPTCRTAPPGYQPHIPRMLLFARGRNSVESREECGDSLNSSIECLFPPDDMSVSPTTETDAAAFSEKLKESPVESSEFPFHFSPRGIGLARSNLLRKKSGMGGTPKAWKQSATSPQTSPQAMTSLSFRKRQKNADINKRSPKAKIRGMFGMAGVALQKPTREDGGKDEEDNDNRLVLVSSTDDFVLSQDVCAMCGAFGQDLEGRLIACSQCGQCYHPYCVNIKLSKVLLTKGWRCLDCTVCEGCGQHYDEARIILCDECDISYHIYCLDPPLEHVPQGNWKCKWCSVCEYCGATDPGANCTWQLSYSACGACASHTVCPVCLDKYEEGDLIIKCGSCSRYLHGLCDFVRNEEEADACGMYGYTCVLCRPQGEPPPHFMPGGAQDPTKLNSNVTSDFLRLKSDKHFTIDGVSLSEWGMNQIREMDIEQEPPAKRRFKGCGTMVGHGMLSLKLMSSIVEGSEDRGAHDGDEDMLHDHAVKYKRKPIQRSGLGIGGFYLKPSRVRLPKPPIQQELDGEGELLDDRPKRPRPRPKPRTKLSQIFPPSMQDAFFGKELVDICKERTKQRHEDSSSGLSDSEDDENKQEDHVIDLTEEEVKTLAAVKEKQENIKRERDESKQQTRTKEKSPIKEEEMLQEEDVVVNLQAFKSGLHVDLLENEEIDSLLHEELSNNELQNIPESALEEMHGERTKDGDISEILGPGFNLEGSSERLDRLAKSLAAGFPNMDGKDVEDLFKGVLPDEPPISKPSETSRPRSVLSPLGYYPSPRPRPPTIVRGMTPTTVMRPQGMAFPGGRATVMAPRPNFVTGPSSPTVNPPSGIFSQQNLVTRPPSSPGNVYPAVRGPTSPGNVYPVRAPTPPGNVYPPRAPASPGNVFPPRAPASPGNVFPPRAPASPGNVFPSRPPTSPGNVYPPPRAPTSPGNVYPAPRAPTSPGNVYPPPRAPASPGNVFPPRAPTSPGNVYPPLRAPTSPGNVYPPPRAPTSPGNVYPPPRAPASPGNVFPPRPPASPGNVYPAQPSPTGAKSVMSPMAPSPSAQPRVTSPMSFPSSSFSEFNRSTSSDSWSSGVDGDGHVPTGKERSIIKWESEEDLGGHATISAVLYANVNHPELKEKYPEWLDRAKQITRIWRALPAEKRNPFVQKAKENRTLASRQKSQQQRRIGPPGAGGNPVSPLNPTPSPAPPPPPTTPVQMGGTTTGQMVQVVRSVNQNHMVVSRPGGSQVMAMQGVLHLRHMAPQPTEPQPRYRIGCINTNHTNCTEPHTPQQQVARVVAVRQVVPETSQGVVPRTVGIVVNNTPPRSVGTPPSSTPSPQPHEPSQLYHGDDNKGILNVLTPSQIMKTMPPLNQAPRQPF